MIELEQDQENSVRIARFLYRRRFFPRFDSPQNDYPIDNVHAEFFGTLA